MTKNPLPLIPAVIDYFSYLQKMLEYQKQQLNLAMKELGINSLQLEDMKKSDIGTEDVKKYNTSTKDCVKELEKKLMNIKSMRPSD